ncbi:hypothetical protein UFOVP1346_7 [uncultured Caudovirales phage]|uniref:Uncharacterized protein n=1 Tax=uncultured Caudovirales phage TaxID=2100421 RepID=A0A6J5RV33_9CAUD|nr:hypothetical protein UFOVP921_47 [uncultured Caudovirales phage]CAB4187434.1 hypothetical protein UFOVP1156_23 [uncultured Caudovirales phage]CAB4199822.1 hypothetical protein UFOVP1346_7 [uncultured Caudovirales phage]
MKVIENGAFCAACFSFVTDRSVVEFDASWDGPVIPEGSVDELSLCESCVRSAAEALDVSPDVVARLENSVKFSEGVAEKWRSYALSLERSLEFRPEKVVKTGRKPA